MLPEIDNNNADKTTSVAGFILSTIDQLQNACRLISEGEALTDVIIKEISFSIPYDPGEGKPPIEKPEIKEGQPYLHLSQAKTFFLKYDRKVFLVQSELKRVLPERITRFDIRIRF